MNYTKLAPNFFAGPQIETADLEILVRKGVTDVVCNRPDSEHPHGAVSEVMSKVAEKLGLKFHYLPITPGEPFVEQAKHLAQLASQPQVTIFAYCRSGARTANAWSLAMSTSIGADK